MASVARSTRAALDYRRRGTLGAGGPRDYGLYDDRQRGRNDPTKAEARNARQRPINFT